ncbi:MAG: TPM domain-containing protein [Gammaproteobacteria bacterium]|jgi:uncharacterized membrane protein YgcG|nr:TPM domain-containing protein [Gammaproteobacteria bacterium]
MNLNSFGYRPILLLSIILFLFSSSSYGASFLQDNAKVVSPEMAEKLEKELGAIESRDGFHLEVVILPNFYGRQPEAVVNAFNEQLAKNAPNVDKRALLLIVTENGVVELRTTNNINSAFDAKSFKDISDNIKIKLHEKNYDEMARIGIAGVYYYYQKVFPNKPTKAAGSNNKQLFNIALFVILLIVVVFLVRAIPKKPLNKS